jgi:hypothetical protein
MKNLTWYLSVFLNVNLKNLFWFVMITLVSPKAVRQFDVLDANIADAQAT